MKMDVVFSTSTLLLHENTIQFKGANNFNFWPYINDIGRFSDLRQKLILKIDSFRRLEENQVEEKRIGKAELVENLSFIVWEARL